VELFVGQTVGDPDSSLLVIHGDPDWDQSYLREPLVRLGGYRRVVFVDLRGCGRSTRGLPVGSYTPAYAVQDLVALIEAFGGQPVDVLGFSYGAARPAAARDRTGAGTPDDHRVEQHPPGR
jgi:pimeloyl-ACP methyl ester carboxylesterase